MFSDDARQVKTDIRQLTEEQARLNREIDREEARLALISDFRRLQPAIADVRQELIRATTEVKRQNDEIKESNTVTDEQNANLIRLRQNQADLRREYNALNAELRRTNTGLRQNRISIDDFDGAVERSTASIREKNVELGRLQVQLRQAGTAAAATASRVDRFKASLTSSIIVMNRMRSGILSVTLAFGALLGLGRLAQFFGDVEQGMVAVSKVTTLTRGELQFLTDELTRLSETVSGSTVPELLSFTAAAGRLGIDGTENLLEFTRVMDQLAVSTNLAGEEGADSFGRLINAVGASRDEYQSLASQLVATGNEVASNEAVIARFATRLGNTTKEAELSTSTIIALAGTMAELGIQAESGGTQIGRVTRDLRTFAAAGGEELDLLVDVIGRTREEIQELGRSDPSTLLNSFLEGLNNLNTGGGEVTQTLIQLGLQNERILGTIPPLALNFETYNDLLRINNDEQLRATALLNEAAKAYAAQNTLVDVFTNTVRNAGIELGRAFSDEYQQSLEDLGQTIQNEEGRFGQLGQTVGTVVEALTRATIEIFEFAKATRLTTGLDKIFVALSGAINVAALSVQGLTILFQGLSIALNTVTGNTEGLAAAQEAFDATNRRATETFEDLTNNARVFFSLSIDSFIDLREAAENNTEAVENLTEVDEELLKQLLKSQNGIEENAQLYQNLTNKINSNAREIQIRTELEKESGSALLETERLLAQHGSSLEKRNELITQEISRSITAIDNQSKLNDARTTANKILGDTIVMSSELQTQLEEGNLTGEDRLDLIERLHAARVLELEDITVLSEEQKKKNEQRRIAAEVISEEQMALESLAQSHADEIRNVIELRQRQEQLNFTHNEATGVSLFYREEVERLDDIINDVIDSTGLEEDEFNSLINVLLEAEERTERLKDSNNELNESIKTVSESTKEYVDNLLSNTTGADDAERSLQALRDRIEENNQAWENGTISITEYNRVNSELESGISELEEVIDTTSSSVDGLSEANQRVIQSNEDVARSNRTTSDTFREIRNSAEEAASSVSSYTQRIEENNAAISARFDELIERDSGSTTTFNTSNGSDDSDFRSFSAQNVADNTEGTGINNRRFDEPELASPSADSNSISVTEVSDPIADRLEEFVEQILAQATGLNVGSSVRSLESEQLSIDSAFRRGEITIEQLNEFTSIINGGLREFSSTLETRQAQEDERRANVDATNARLNEIREERLEQDRAVRTIRLQIQANNTEEAIDIPVYDDEQERAVESIAERLEEVLNNG